VTDPDLRKLTARELIVRLKDLQRTFESGEWTVDGVRQMLIESRSIRTELRHRGLTDLQIEWLFAG
jgi:hypothetical protein